MSGKNIFIGASIVIILLIISFFAFQIQQYNFYKQFATTNQLQDWIISGVKNKDRAKVRVPYCIEQKIGNSTLESSFERFWNDIITEDWSQVEIKSADKNASQKNYTFAVKNIKNQKGEIGNRYFGMQSRYKNRGFPILVQIFSQEYTCFDPNGFKNLEESYKFENPIPGVQKPEIKR